MSTIPTGPVRVPYRITGTVNGKRRLLITDGPRGLDADTVYNELFVNHEANYKRFYRGATEVVPVREETGRHRIQVAEPGAPTLERLRLELHRLRHDEGVAQPPARRPYAPALERGLRWNDPWASVDWKADNDWDWHSAAGTAYANHGHVGMFTSVDRITEAVPNAESMMAAHSRPLTAPAANLVKLHDGISFEQGRQELAAHVGTGELKAADPVRRIGFYDDVEVSRRPFEIDVDRRHLSALRVDPVIALRAE